MDLSAGQKTLLLARDDKRMVEACGTCQQFKPRNQKEPLIPYNIPEIPWLKVGADIFETTCQSFLLIVDYLSKYTEVLNIRDKYHTLSSTR